MRKEEAQTICQIVQDLRLKRGSMCLNIGSSTKYFREISQPHIAADLINPLVSNGLEVVNCDLKEDEGVDLVGDVLDEDFQKEMSNRPADILICSNLLEHVHDPKSFASSCSKFVRPGGYMVVSVPFSYPYHPDPIDTMLRLTPEGIGDFYQGWEVIKKKIIVSNTFLEDLKNSGKWRTVLVKYVLRVCMPFYRPQKWKPMAHRLVWLFRPYKVSLVLFRKPVSE